jgi:hypothetical protein
MKLGQLVSRRDQYGIVVAQASAAWPGCVQVEWSDGRREWVQRIGLAAHMIPPLRGVDAKF